MVMLHLYLPAHSSCLYALLLEGLERTDVFDEKDFTATTIISSTAKDLLTDYIDV